VSNALGVAVVDTMVALPPAPGDESWREQLRPLLKDRESLEGFAHPASYMFKNLPDARFAEDPIAAVLSEMDRFDVEHALVGVSAAHEPGLRALGAHRDRLSGTVEVDPNRAAASVRELRHSVQDWGVVAAACFGAGTFPQRAYDDPAWFPIYAACVELGIPILLTVGIPGPRVPFAPQRVECLDVVCYEFPELTVVMRHGGEPWADLAVKLMLKWPGLYYSTSAFAPKYYPRAIVDYANTRGAEKILFAGYFPMGLSYDTIFEQLPDVEFRDHVWSKFLSENARRVFNLA